VFSISLVVQYHAIDLASIQLGVGSFGGSSSVHTEVYYSIIPMISSRLPIRYQYKPILLSILPSEDVNQQPVVVYVCIT
jgi:hypothetical protein